MFDFTAVLSGTVSAVQGALTLIDPSTFIGGVVAAAITGTLLMRFLRGMRRIAR